MAGAENVDDRTDEWTNSGTQNAHPSCWLTAQPPPRRQTTIQLTSNELDHLARTVETEIIPRLLLAHKLSRSNLAAAAQSQETPTQAEIEAFAHVLLRQDANEGLAYTQTLSERGIHTADLMLGLFAPAARLLGDYWKEDLCDFTEVTLALARLQQILRELNPLVDAERAERDSKEGLAPYSPRQLAFLVATPGEQHSFGLSVVEEFFRRENWDVLGGVVLTKKLIVDAVRSNHFDLIGFSLSCKHFLEELTSTIRAVRKASRNPAIAVMVGGQFFIEHPECVAKVGADATAIDGQQAVENAQKLVKRLERQEVLQPGRS